MTSLGKVDLRRIVTAAITVPAVALFSIANTHAILQRFGLGPFLSIYSAISLAAAPGMILIAIWFKWRALQILPICLPLAICVAAATLWLLTYVSLLFQPPGSFP
jgi:hypothetical protein